MNLIMRNNNLEFERILIICGSCALLIFQMFLTWRALSLVSLHYFTNFLWVYSIFTLSVVICFMLFAVYLFRAEKIMRQNESIELENNLKLELARLELHRFNMQQKSRWHELSMDNAHSFIKTLLDSSLLKDKLSFDGIDSGQNSISSFFDWYVKQAQQLSDNTNDNSLKTTIDEMISRQSKSTEK